MQHTRKREWERVREMAANVARRSRMQQQIFRIFSIQIDFNRFKIAFYFYYCLPVIKEQFVDFLLQFYSLHFTMYKRRYMVLRSAATTMSPDRNWSLLNFSAIHQNWNVEKKNSSTVKCELRLLEFIDEWEYVFRTNWNEFATVNYIYVYMRYVYIIFRVLYSMPWIMLLAAVRLVMELSISRTASSIFILFSAHFDSPQTSY